jgi:TM2 domain-containing membrane protein YozV
VTSAVCPYCRSEVDPDAGESSLICEGCGTPHHRECFEENNGCTLFGCSLAPPDDPKVQVTTGEVAYSTDAFSAYAVSAPTGFGDAAAPIRAYAPAPVMSPPPPPPPPPPGTVAAAPAISSVPEAELIHCAITAVPNAPSAAELSTILSSEQKPAKSRLTFILLGIFLGAFGVHNFYAGYFKRGMAQVGLTVLTLFYGSLVTWIWALVEVVTVDRDVHNVLLD